MIESDRRFHAIVEQAAVGIAVVDLEGRILDANAAYSRMLGYASGELDGATVSMITHPDDAQETLPRFEELAAGELDSYDLEKRYVRKDGSTFWGHVIASLVRDESGSPEFVVATIEDVDTRRRAEEQVREAEIRYRTLVEQLPLVTYIDALDERSSNVYTSPQLESVLGYTVAEWQSDPDLFVRILHPDDRERVLAEVRRTNASGERFACEYRLVARDGHAVWFRDECVVVYDRSGEPAYSQGYLLDITERKEAEEALRESEERFRSMADNAPVLIWTADPSGTVTFFSQAWLDFTGRTLAEEIGDGWAEMVHPDDLDVAYHAYMAAIREHQPYEAEYRLRRADGEYRWILDRGRPNYRPDGTLAGYIGVGVEVTEQRNARAALERRERIMQAVARIAGELVTRASWEEVDVVGQLGRAIDASRTYLFENHRSEKGAVIGRQLAEWVAPGVRPMIDDAGLAAFDYLAAGFGRWAETLSTGGVVQGPIRDFPERERAELERQDIRSVLEIPVLVEGSWWGVLGFDDCELQRRWSEAEIDALRAAAGILGEAIRRQWTARSLQEATATLEALVTNSPAAIVGFDTEGSVILWNPAAEDLLGWTAEEALAGPNPFVEQKDSRQEFDEYLQRGLSGQTWSTADVVRLREDGSEVVVNASSAPLRNGDGSIIGVASVLVDMTAKKQTQDALTESEARFAAFMDTTPAVAFAKDAEGRYVYVNARWREFFGHEPEEVLGRTDADVFPEYADVFRSDDAAALAAGRPVRKLEHVEARDLERTLLTFKFPFRDALGREYVGGVALDVTEQERAQEELRETTQLLGALVESSPVAIVTSDRDGLVTGWNPAAESMFGWRREEVLGKPPPHFVPDDPDGLASRERANKGETVTDAEAVRLRKDGTRVDVSYSKAPLRAADGAIVGTTAILTDITERKRAEEALSETTHALEAIVDSSPLAIVTLDDQGRVTRWSEAATRMFGWTEAEVIGRFNPILPEGEEEGFLETIGLALTGRSWRNLEVRRRHKDGRAIDVSASSAPLRDASGQAIGLVAVLADVTERKRTEQRLEAQHAVTRALAESATLEEAAPRLLAEVCGSLDWDLGGIWLVDSEADRLRLASMWHGDGGRFEQFVDVSWTLELERGAGLPGRVWETGEPAWFADVVPASRARSAAIAASGLHGALATPITSGGLVIGVLELLVREVREPDADLLPVLVSFGSQIGQFIARVQADQDLRAREEQFRTLVANLPGAIYRCSADADWTMSYMSDAIREITGHAGAEFIDNSVRSYASVIHPDDRADVDRIVGEGVRRKEPFELEYRVMHADGSVRWVSEKGQPIIGPGGEVLWLDGAIFDVTERRRAEADLATERDLMRIFMHATPDHIYFKDRESRFLRISETLARWLGLDDPAEAIGKTDFDFFTGEHAAKARADEEELLRTGEPMLDIEDKETWPDGSVTWVVSSRLPLRDEQGEIVGTFGISRDITQRKLDEEELAGAKNLLDSIVESLPTPLFLKDAEELRFVRVNRAAEELWGFDRAALLGKSDRDFFPPEQAEFFIEKDRHVVDAQELLDVPEEPIETKELGTRYLHTRKVPIVDESGTSRYLLGISLDITEAKLAAAELERLLGQLEEQNERLRQLDRMKDEFVALVSHELRTPLTSILGYLELVLEGDAGAVTEDQEHFLSIIERNAQRLLRLVGDLLFVAQIEAGKLTIEREPVDLAQIAADCIEAARPRATEKELDLSLESKLAAAILGDKTRLAQLFDNLVSNAIKFTPEGGNVRVRLAVDERRVVLTVSDTGMGIPPDEQANLFQRFFRTSEATKRAIQGTGLGLAITKAIAEAHGGSIAVESEAGKGTTFVVELPVEAALSSGREPMPIEEAGGRT